MPQEDASTQASIGGSRQMGAYLLHAQKCHFSRKYVKTCARRAKIVAPAVTSAAQTFAQSGDEITFINCSRPEDDGRRHALSVLHT